MNDTLTVDGAIEQIEKLYKSVTGKTAPPVGEEPYATIPPEKVPEEHVQEQVDRLVQALGDFSGKAGIDAQWRPLISLGENRDEMLIHVDLPGVPREAVHVAVNRGLLEIYGDRPPQTAPEGEPVELKYSESPFGKFRRTIPLPLSARIEQLQAQMRAGVLEIRVPREAGASSIRTIHVS
jgi:HSP20 family protein